MKEVTAALVSLFLGFVLSFGLTLLACHFGYAFSGLDTLFTVGIGTAVCFLTTLIVLWLRKRKTWQMTPRWLLGQLLVASFISVACLSVIQARQHLRIIGVPETKDVHLLQGRSTLFSTFVHFSARPDDIAAILKSKELTFVPESDEVTGMVPDGFDVKEGSRSSWDWWQPERMQNPRFFFRSHRTDGPQNWVEGWWISGATNEVFAFIKG